MAEEATTYKTDSKLEINGFSVMCAWHFLVIFTAVLNIDAAPETGRYIWIQLTIYLGLAVSYAFIAKTSKAIVRRFFRSGSSVWRNAIILISILAAIASLLVVISSGTPLALQIIIYLFLAFTGSLLIFPWLQLPQVRDSSSVNYKTLALNMGAGAVFAIIISFLQNPIGQIAICVLPIISTALLIARWSGTDALAESSSGSVDANRSISASEIITTNIHFIVFGLAFGFVQGTFAQGQSVTFALNDGMPLIGAVLSALVIFFAPYKYLRSYGIFILQRAGMLLFFTGLFLALYFSQDGSVFDALPAGAGFKIAQILTFAGFNIFEFGFMVFSFAWAAKLRSDFAGFIGYNRSLLYLGMGCGLAAGFYLHELAGNMPGFEILAAGAAVFVLTLTTLPVFDGFAPYGTFTTAEEARAHEEQMKIEMQIAPGEINEEQDPRSDAQQSEEEATENMQDAQQPEKRHSAPWRERVSKLADEHDLSDRERDVFFYLAKGRNAAFIQQELWISIHTVKTHISNIYRKLGVHSIQEVLDLVDGAAHYETQEGFEHGEEQEEKGEHPS